MFINRKEELKALEERWKSPKAEFMVLYGRRRVGKTELIEHFLKNKKGIRLLGRTETEKSNLERFSKDLSELFKEEHIKINPFQSWDAFFSLIASKAEKERIAIAIDEFPYLIDASKPIPSVLQDWWDRKLKNSNIFLILCGSSISMMVGKVLSHKSPLYGRRTGQIKVEPMGFFSACEFFNKFTAKELVYAYSILGGTPGYLLEFDEKKSIRDNIKDSFLRKDKFLFQDAEFVLKEELKEPKFYFAILRAIAIGKTTIGDIMNETGLQKGIVGKYLSVLAELDLVKREIPVTEKQPHKSRKGIYILKDNFYRFWFNFVSPNIEEIEQNRQDMILSSKIMPELDHYTSYIFEKICAEWLWKLALFDYEKVGKWWDKEQEIDIVAVAGKRILFAECKWQDNVDARKLLEELKVKAKLVEWHNNGREESYALFARSFKSKIEGCFDLKDLEKEVKKRVGA